MHKDTVAWRTAFAKKKGIKRKKNQSRVNGNSGSKKKYIIINTNNKIILERKKRPWVRGKSDSKKKHK